MYRECNIKFSIEVSNSVSFADRDIRAVYVHYIWISYSLDRLILLFDIF